MVEFLGRRYPCRASAQGEDMGVDFSGKIPFQPNGSGAGRFMA